MGSEDGVVSYLLTDLQQRLGGFRRGSREEVSADSADSRRFSEMVESGSENYF